MLQILHKTNIDFMGWKNISFAVSGLLIALGIVGLVQVWRGHANLGIDFVGGTTVQLGFKEKIPIDKARTALEKSGFQGATVQEVGEGNKILIKV
ncbi:MAG TPA: protein translocase subunit SecF, partial [Nitrospirota bacterium]